MKNKIFLVDVILSCGVSVSGDCVHHSGPVGCLTFKRKTSLIGISWHFFPPSFQWWSCHNTLAGLWKEAQKSHSALFDKRQLSCWKSDLLNCKGFQCCLVETRVSRVLLERTKKERCDSIQIFAQNYKQTDLTKGENSFSKDEGNYKWKVKVTGFLLCMGGTTSWNSWGFGFEKNVVEFYDGTFTRKM